MIGLILFLPFIIETCLAEADYECNISTLRIKTEISTQGLFDNSLNAFYEKKWEKASEGFAEIVKCGEIPWRGRSIFMLGKTYLEMGKIEEARDLFMKAISEYDVLADYSLYYLAESFLREKDYESSNEVLRLLYKAYPESVLKGMSQFTEARSLYLSGRYVEAVDAFEVFIKENRKDPMVSEAKLYKGRALKAEGKIEQAVEVFKELWIEDPASPSADRAAEEIISLELNARDYLLRAENLFKASQYSKAIPDYQKTLELEKDTERINEISLRLAISLFRTKRYDEAIDIFKGILNQESEIRYQGVKEALYYLTTAYLRKGSMDRFIKSVHEFYRRYPEDRKTPELLLMLADELRRSGSREKALTLYNTIINEYPDASMDALYRRGWMDYMAGNFEKSSRDMRLIVERYPDSPIVPQALYWEARGYEKTGDSLKAEALYRNVIKEYPSSFYGYMAKRRLKGKGISVNTMTIDPSFSQISGKVPDIFFSEIPFPKIGELKILGMKDEAVAELDHLRNRQISKTSDTSGDLENLIKIGKTYFDLDEYNKAISMADGYSRRDKRFSYFLYPLGFWAILGQSSEETMIDPYLIAAVIREESRFDPKAVSRAGAMGLMQIIPSTWKWIEKQTNKRTETKDERQETKEGGRETSIIKNSSLVTHHSSLKIDPFNPRENIARGTRYLRYLLDKFNQNLIIALSAYNAGPEAVNSWLKNGPEEPDEFVEEIPYGETRGYVKRVLRSYEEYRRIYNISD